MTRKLFFRLMCLSSMLLLLTSSHPMGAGSKPLDRNPTCSSLCFRQYMDCMWAQEPYHVCEQAHIECMAQCPEEEPLE